MSMFRGLVLPLEDPDIVREIRAAAEKKHLAIEPNMIASLSLDEYESIRTDLERLANGRSLNDSVAPAPESAQTDQSTRSITTRLKDQKRITYALRLARGEQALKEAIQIGNIEVTSDLRNGVRAIHDITIPRTHMEVTVCGAVPPFAQAMGGKLVISFLGHPYVVSASKQTEGQLLAWSFDFPRLDPLLPNHGLLCISTKGLYSKHAPLYERAEFPGTTRPVRLRHLANTAGQTTTLVSEKTVRLAKRLVEQTHGTTQRGTVSQTYGSGGAKRHRIIDAAVALAKLPSKFAYAGIQRPVYGAYLVTNAPDVAWFNDTPKWLIPTNLQPAEASSEATDNWRRRYLRKAQDRAREYILTPTLTTLLLS
jgi:hypothetical protein